MPVDVQWIALSDRGVTATMHCRRGIPDTLSRLRLITAWCLDVARSAFVQWWCSISEAAALGVGGFRPVNDVVWELSAVAHADTRVPARVFADRELIGEISADRFA